MQFSQAKIKDEISRILCLTELDIDYPEMQSHFKDMTRLAARVAGTEISMINLVDMFTHWTIAQHGIPAVGPVPREESICQYTILSKEPFEVTDLSADERFCRKPFVLGGPRLRYYMGIPLTTKDDFQLGSLCVLDKDKKEMDAGKIEMLQIIAGEIVSRFQSMKMISDLKTAVHESFDNRRKVAHDIRGPLGGIIGLSQVIRDEGNKMEMGQLLEFVDMIEKSGHSLLYLADEILHTEKKPVNNIEERSKVITLGQFKEKLGRLYEPQAKMKNIEFTVNTTVQTEHPFPKTKVLQIAGNLISNAMKFTPQNGSVDVFLGLKKASTGNGLNIVVRDSGVGIDEKSIQYILEGQATTTDGTGGEKGYGLGLPLVKRLVDSLKGSMNIHSIPGKGSAFEINLPQLQW